MKANNIRLIGDPILNTISEEILDINDDLIQLTQIMHESMLKAGGIGISAPQIGTSKRLFVYDMGNGLNTLINPTVPENEGEWIFEEGCLSIPGYFWKIIRPKKILVKGRNLNGDDVEFEADKFLSRLIQHEIDHLNGVLLLERLGDDEKEKATKNVYRTFEI